MEASASAPAFTLPREPPPTQEEYHLPVTSTPGRALLGKFPKDSGLNSSRLAEIQKQAKKTPGPGRYIPLDIWGNDKVSTGRTNKFSKGPRFVGDADTMVKKRGPIPGPGHYENKAVGTQPINGVSKNLSNMKRVLFGNLSKAGKETYIDRICKSTTVGPPCSKYAYTSKSAIKRNELETQVFSLAWKEHTAVSKKQKVGGSLSPNHYKISYKLAEPQPLVSAFPKEKQTNFIDKNSKSKAFCPAPGKYDLIKLEKISRGTKFLQVNNMGKGALAGIM